LTDQKFSCVLLVGFMGSGKTSVGCALASALGWRFRDFDDAVESDMGMSVPKIFERLGEAAFRDAEERVGERLLGEDQVVLGSGGGWAAATGRLEALPEGTASIWLQVSADEAVRRVSGQIGRRPLLAGSDPAGTARMLLDQRSAAYAAARWRVDTERHTVEDVSARILRLLTGNDQEAEP
jgi:shikimate kinase